MGVNAVSRAMKSKKKKIALPRRRWQMNPVERVKESAKVYDRHAAKRAERSRGTEE